MKIFEQFSNKKPKGSVSITVENLDGSRYNFFEKIAEKKWLNRQLKNIGFKTSYKPNLIVNTARVTLASLIANGGTSNVIRNIHVGTGDTDPTVNDTALEDGSPFVKLRDSVTFFPTGINTGVTFHFVLNTNEANGGGLVSYTEAGLVTDNGDLFSRITFPALNKNNTLRIYFDWSISF